MMGKFMSKKRRSTKDGIDKIKRLNIAAVAMQCDEDPNKNLDYMIDFIQRIKREQSKVELIVFGETILGWFFKPGKTKEYHQEIAETIPGKSTMNLAEIAKKENVYLTFGISDKEGEVIFNSQVIINPKGEIQTVHRKFLSRDETFQAGKKKVTLTEIMGIKTGIIICFDVRSSQVVKEMKKNKPELIIHSMADDEDPKFFGAGFLARNFGTWYVTANRYGYEGKKYWSGHMFISNPKGKLCTKSTDKEDYIYYSIEIPIKKSKFKGLFQNIGRKISLIFHILKNLKIALSYVTDASKVRRRKRQQKRRLKRQK
ncbi:MAG: carbon-nitrogen hydrolase family protein [Asgard group archaeon]|nr:carbon-nitrogen hydrolase family protein [Asgard group archaeon]